MPDTSNARAAIRRAREWHPEVMGGMSSAQLKLEAAGGVLHLDPGEELPFPADDPEWLSHALQGLGRALDACDKLRDALLAADDEIARLVSDRLTETRADSAQATEADR